MRNTNYLIVSRHIDIYISNFLFFLSIDFFFYILVFFMFFFYVCHLINMQGSTFLTSKLVELLKNSIG